MDIDSDNLMMYTASPKENITIRKEIHSSYTEISQKLRGIRESQNYLIILKYAEKWEAKRTKLKVKIENG